MALFGSGGLQLKVPASVELGGSIGAGHAAHPECYTGDAEPRQGSANPGFTSQHLGAIANVSTEDAVY